MQSNSTITTSHFARLLQSFRTYGKIQEKRVLRAQKGILSKIKKKKPRYSSTPRRPNFKMIGSFFTSLGCPEVLEKNRSQ